MNIPDWKKMPEPKPLVVLSWKDKGMDAKEQLAREDVIGIRVSRLYGLGHWVLYLLGVCQRPN